MTRLVPKTSGGWLTAFLLVILLLLAAYQVGNPHSYVSEAFARLREANSGPTAALTDLSSVDQLKAAFSQDAGYPRLILLLSRLLPLWVRRWATVPGPLLSSGRTVIGSSGDLAAAFHKLA